jgi:hypothetical protein
MKLSIVIVIFLAVFATIVYFTKRWERGHLEARPAARPFWIYVLPCLHLCLASLIAIAFYAQLTQPIFDRLNLFLLMADFPISLIAVALGMAKHEVLAFLWTAVVSTYWWYFLSVCCANLLDWLRRSMRQRAAP